MSKIKTILVVCTGNSCRSVMAEGLLQAALKDKGDYDIISAGVAAPQGMRPTAETVQVMSEQGLDISNHRSALLNNEMIEQADLILVMELRHKVTIANLAPAAEGKINLLAEFGRMEGEYRLVNPDIADPIGKPLNFYRQVFKIIQEAVERTTRKLAEQDKE
ncbi:low molecular weight protein arginine phosphatase [Candidatus Omnitrophota bacterium]